MNQFTINEEQHYKGPFSEKAKKPKFSSATDEYEWAKNHFKDCSKCHKNLSLVNNN